MTTANEIEEALFDADGSVRDITFKPVSLSRVPHLLSHLNRDFMVHTAMDHNGEDLRPSIASEALDGIVNQDRGYILSYWSSPSHAISELQAFISWPQDDGSCFVELTFNPRDLIKERFSLEDFLATVEQWAAILDADDYFVRYENASWAFYDSRAPDVIYTQKTKPTQNTAAHRTG